MKKFLKLCLAVAALATMFGFASCSNDSSNDSTANAAAATASAATKNGETKTEPGANAAPVATENVFKGKTFVSPDGMSFIFGSDGNLTAAVKVDEKFNITKQAYTVNGNAFSATIGKMNASGTLSGKTLTIKVSKGGEYTDTATLIE